MYCPGSWNLRRRDELLWTNGEFGPEAPEVCALEITFRRGVDTEVHALAGRWTISLRGTGDGFVQVHVNNDNVAGLLYAEAAAFRPISVELRFHDVVCHIAV